MRRDEMLKFVQHMMVATDLLATIHRQNTCGSDGAAYEPFLNEHLDAMCELLEPELESNVT